MTISVASGGSQTVRIPAVSGGSPLGTVYQTMEGFGSMVRVWTHPDFWGLSGPGPVTVPSLSEAQKNAIMDALYTTTGVGLTRMRVCDPTSSRVASGVNAFDIEASNDNADPQVINAAGFDFSGPRAADVVDWVTRARARDLQTWWWSPSFREAWLGAGDAWMTSTPNATDVAEYAEWCLAILDFFRDSGIQTDYICIGNEPSYPNGANRMSPQYVRDIIKELCPRLNTAGLLKPLVLGDDNTLAYMNALVDVVMADATAATYVNYFATHLYDGPLSNAAGLKTRSETYGKPLWMSEFSHDPMNTISDWTAGNTAFSYAQLMHELISAYNFAAIDYMMGIIGQQEPNTLINANYTGSTYTGYTIKKVGYYFGQYAKFVRPGDKRVSVSTSDSGAKVTAFWRSSGTRTIVAINPTGSPITTTLTAADLSGVANMTPTRSSASEDWVSLSPVAVSGTSISVTLPASSITTFVGTA